jgi:hypothetical protein
MHRNEITHMRLRRKTIEMSYTEKRSLYKKTKRAKDDITEIK